MKISTEVPADLGKKVEKDFGLDSKTFVPLTMERNARAGFGNKQFYVSQGTFRTS